MSAAVTPPFGPAAAEVLARAGPVLGGATGEFMARFHTALLAHAGAGAVLARLDPAEADALRDRQERHLAHLTSPSLTEAETVGRSRRVGRVHAMVGVEVDWYAAALVEYQRAVLVTVAASEELAADVAALHAVIAQRLGVDLQGVLSGHRDDHAGLARAMMAVSRVAVSAENVPDLIRGVFDALVTMDGIAAGWFGRPDPAGVFRREVGAGEGAEDLLTGSGGDGRVPITTSVSDPSGLGPSGRAWRSGAIERTDAYTTDPTTAPWHAIGRRHGWRASAAVPLTGGDGAVRALLNLYAHWPGYFAPPARRGFLTQLRQTLEPALARLEADGRGAGAAVRDHRTRARSLSRLEGGEVRMLYQPVVSLRGGRVLKLEALARLVDGARLIGPAEFLPAMGDAELLRLFDLGLDRGLTALAAWEGEGLVTGVALNLPTSCLRDPRYVAVVDRALARHGTDPARLTLELLETGLAGEDARWHGQVLQELRSLGVHLAEDDLGAGYSSLFRLRSIPFTEVKLDQGFIRDAERSPREGLGFVHPLANLAHSLGLTVVAEGLETDGLVEAAALLGADAGQGFAIARPMEADAVPGWASGFRPAPPSGRPVTALGALAGHLAWEQRRSAVRTSPSLARLASLDDCPLTAYLGGLDGDAAALADAHRALHAAALDEPGDGHARAWNRLTGLLRRTPGARWS